MVIYDKSSNLLFLGIIIFFNLIFIIRFIYFMYDFPICGHYTFLSTVLDWLRTGLIKGIVNTGTAFNQPILQYWCDHPHILNAITLAIGVFLDLDNNSCNSNYDRLRPLLIVLFNAIIQIDPNFLYLLG